MDYETSLLTEAFSTHKKVLEMIFNCQLSNFKDPKTSEEIRKKGNILLCEKKHSNKLHNEILRHYNQSAALAPKGSQQLVSAYANRSAFLLHISKYEECIQDLQKALKIVESDELKIKLLCRKVECLKNLGNTWENVLDEVQSLMNTISEDDKNKKKLEELVNKVTTLSVAEKTESNQETNELANLPITDNLLDKVSIRHDEKYGRYLKAEQDYNPGDIIFVEKLGSISVEASHRYTNCHYCIKICWSGIPCDHCDWVIFCSENCRQSAWEEYHDIECLVGSLSGITMSDVFWVPNFLSLKVLTKAMKVSGHSIANLRAQLQAVNDCADVCSKGFYKDGKFANNTIENFYSLTNKANLTPKEIRDYSRISLTTMIGLLKNPRMNMFSVDKFEDVINDKDMVFLGSLLIKLMAIESNNAFSVAHFLNDIDANRGLSPVSRGRCFAPLASLINHSCCPNTSRCFTENGNIIIFAVKPIKKNEQIFTSYCEVYYSERLEERKSFLQDYNFNCDCDACTQRWPALLIEDEIKRNLKDSHDITFAGECCDIIEDMDNQNYSKATFEKLSEKIVLALECVKQPSTFTCLLLKSVDQCITSIYNGLKPLAFGKCKIM